MTAIPNNRPLASDDYRSEPVAAASYAAVLGRLLLCAIFLISGFGKLTHWSMYVGYMGSKGVPSVNVMLALATFAELAGGLSLLLGLWSRLGALGLFVYLIPTTIIFHRFWGLADPAIHQEQFINFLKNVAIMGGLLMIVAFGPGPLSVDAARRGKVGK